MYFTDTDIYDLLSQEIRFDYIQYDFILAKKYKMYARRTHSKLLILGVFDSGIIEYFSFFQSQQFKNKI